MKNGMVISKDKFLNEIKDKNQLQRFLRCLNYVANFIPKVKIICKPLFNRLVRIQNLVKTLSCLGIPHPKAFMIVETNASDIGFGGILKQK
uniref:Enzymatic polyprotein n=1 Tax=Cajanus cajan TaxID=3821 RepID=A0A151R9V5_CAJCA|nr:Enzymatic polyprotein [Cajanus cajan]KYP39330.1 Enzymatic polyprotein [Cajanus cajan]KYP39331.1 Enzymatic polyprotein [Cajanus cajan]